MKKILNGTDQVVEQMVEGLVKSHADVVHRVEGTRVIARNDKRPGKVGLVSGGGSGHEPAHAGYVGRGMLSAAVCGDVFTSPTPDQIYEGIKAADQGAGVLLIVKNYTGDVMNFEMAAEAGASLDELKALGEKVIASVKTLGVALSPCTVPEVGHPGFELGDDEIELGIGIHGEPGFTREKIMPSASLAKQLYERISNESKLLAGDKVVVLVNGMGATPLMEQYVFANDVHELLKNAGVQVAKTLVGDYMTSLEMAGLSLTILKLEDEKWVDMLKLPVDTIAW
ncbi:dihydroxyacetone kinase subunit DhaK [Listeria monocytogenes]|nr:dihydroxyacetone kinase subunit DhaK [Listeria monocytogenes]